MSNDTSMQQEDSKVTNDRLPKKGSGNLLARAKANFKQVYKQLGDILKQRNQLDEAIKCYQKTLSIKPDFKIVYRSLGDIFMAQGKEIEAKQCYQRA